VKEQEKRRQVEQNREKEVARAAKREHELYQKQAKQTSDKKRDQMLKT
jgi:hypothetical protein